MALDLDGFDLDSPLDEGNFNRVSKGGRYHLVVQNVNDQGGKVIVDFDVIGGTESDQVGRNFREFFTNNELQFNRRKLVCFAVASGLTTVAKLKAAQQNGANVDISWEDAISQDVCAEVEMHTYEGKTNPRIKGVMLYHPTNAKAEDIPRGDAIGSDDDDPFKGI
jgi:hypothetical protein